MLNKYKLPALLMMVIVMLFMSACGGSSQPAGQVILNSTNAMKQIKAVHINMTGTVNLAISGAPSSTSTSSTPNNVNLTLNANGDEVLPDQQSLNLTTSGIGKFAFAEIVKGNKVYIQNAHGQWYVMDKSKLTGTTGSNPLTNASIPDFNKLLQLAQKDVQVTDHGDEKLNGVSLRHITLTLDKSGFEQLIQSTGELKGLTGANQQTLNDMLNSVNNFNASLDFWIDESTSYLHRFELKLNTALDLSKFASPTANSASSTTSGFSLKADIIVDLSKFNDSSIKITAPANAIPTDNPGVIFGG